MKVDKTILTWIFKEAKVNQEYEASNTKLAIICACHSGELAKLIQELGIPSVITINSADAVYEKAMMRFTKTLLN